MRGRVLAALMKSTDGGRIPVVSDAASCTEGFERLVAASSPAIVVLDAVAFAARHVLPRLPAGRRIHSLALHPTCSSSRLGLDADIARVAGAVAENVVIPDGWQCCAFAGDRGLLHPELTASATRDEAASVRAGQYTSHASVNRTCEIGMSRATGQPYHHLLELLDEVTGCVPESAPPVR
jgi:D-lactate dehydrogenase